MSEESAEARWYRAWAELTAPQRELALEDLMVFGRSVVRQNGDGSIDVIPPEDLDFYPVSE